MLESFAMGACDEEVVLDPVPVPGTTLIPLASDVVLSPVEFVTPTPLDGPLSGAGMTGAAGAVDARPRYTEPVRPPPAPPVVVGAAGI